MEPVWSASILARKGEDGPSRTFEVVERTESVFWEMLLVTIHRIRRDGYLPREIRIDRR